MAKKKNNTPLIVGAVAGGCLLLCMCGGVAGGLIYMGSSADSYDYSYDMPAVDTTAAIGGSGIAAAISILPGAGGSDWDTAVKALMIASYDANSNGVLDTASEVASVPCDVWKITDTGVRGKWTYGVRTIYGFDGGAWIGDAIGYAEAQRAAADAKAVSCGLTDE